MKLRDGPTADQDVVARLRRTLRRQGVKLALEIADPERVGRTCASVLLDLYGSVDRGEPPQT